MPNIRFDTTNNHRIINTSVLAESAGKSFRLDWILSHS
jgi:hypothetical protein